MKYHYGYYRSASDGVRQVLFLGKSLAERVSAVEPAGRDWKKKTANGWIEDKLTVFLNGVFHCR